MATIIAASGRNNIAVDGLVLPKFWFTSLEPNPYPENGIIPASLICWRAGDHVKITIPDLLDTTAGTEGFAFTFTLVSGVFFEIANNRLLDPISPRIKVATTSGVSEPEGFNVGDRIRVGPDGSVFLIKKINDLLANEIEFEIDKPGTTDDLSKIQADSSIVQLWNKNADILAHRNKIHALTF